MGRVGFALVFPVVSRLHDGSLWLGCFPEYRYGLAVGAHGTE